MSKVVDWSKLGNADRELVERAQEACAQAYAPYSLFAVGAAARSKSGSIYTGANLENASSGLTICAEAAALTAASSAGDLALETIAVVGLSFNDTAGASRVVTPCGSCRQLITEMAQLTQTDVRILCCNGELTSIVEAMISQLLPNAFGPDNLGLRRQWPALQQQLRARVKQLIDLRRTKGQVSR
jgi:cytidine deaminase